MATDEPMGGMKSSQFRTTSLKGQWKFIPTSQKHQLLRES
jgi:hypothetical protein